MLLLVLNILLLLHKTSPFLETLCTNEFPSRGVLGGCYNRISTGQATYCQAQEYCFSKGGILAESNEDLINLSQFRDVKIPLLNAPLCDRAGYFFCKMVVQDGAKKKIKTFTSVKQRSFLVEQHSRICLRASGVMDTVNRCLVKCFKEAGCVSVVYNDQKLCTLVYYSDHWLLAGQQSAKIYSTLEQESLQHIAFSISSQQASDAYTELENQTWTENNYNGKHICSLQSQSYTEKRDETYVNPLMLKITESNKIIFQLVNKRMQSQEYTPLLKMEFRPNPFVASSNNHANWFSTEYLTSMTIADQNVNVATFNDYVNSYRSSMGLFTAKGYILVKSDVRVTRRFTVLKPADSM